MVYYLEKNFDAALDALEEGLDFLNNCFLENQKI